jgi:DNA-directed RNA polymerase specialized sigma24 family protein
MQPDPEQHEAILLAARRGALAITKQPAIVEDAAGETLDRWHDAMLRNRSVSDWPAWAYAVARNAAKRLLSRQHRAAVPLHDGLVEATASSQDPADGDHIPPEVRRALANYLASKSNLLRGRQLEVVLKLAEPDMTYRRAAKELCMPRFNLKRSFRSALRRLSASDK